MADIDTTSIFLTQNISDIDVLYWSALWSTHIVHYRQQSSQWRQCYLLRFRTSRDVTGVTMYHTTKLEGHSVERMYLRQRPKSENWASLTPCSSATVRRTKKLSDRGNSLALGLQRGVNGISLQCISWPIVLWLGCLFDPFQVRGLGGKWPMNGKFS